MRTIKKPALIYPKGTHRTPTFYFRGADQFQESESKEYEIRSLGIYEKSLELELNQIREEEQKVSDELVLMESYVTQISEKVGNSNSEHQKLLIKHKELLTQISEVDEEIKSLKKMQNPLLLEQLTREHASFSPDIATLSAELKKNLFQIKDARRKTNEIKVSDNYLFSLQACTEVSVANETRIYLKDKLMRLCKSQNTRPSANNSKRTFSTGQVNQHDQKLNSLFDTQQESLLEKEEVLLLKVLAQKHSDLLVGKLKEYSSELGEIIQKLSDGKET